MHARGSESSRKVDAEEALDSGQTLKLLALQESSLPQTPGDVGLDALHHATFLQLPMGVGYANREGTLIWCNEAFEQMLGLAPGEYRNKSIRDITHSSHQDSDERLTAELWEGKRSSYALDKRYVRKDGVDMWVRVTASLVRKRDGTPVCSVGFLEDITVQKKMQAEMERVQKALVDASRQAGMAEVATNVLHNVGNVLNSVNVSASMVTERLKGSKVARLGTVAKLLGANVADIGNYLLRDSRGQKVLPYLEALSGQLVAERDAQLAELESLRTNIDHIKETVSMQQAYARRCGVQETARLQDLVEDALRMNAGALTRHQVTLKRDFRADSWVTLDKHKVLQILVNLVRNAKHACEESGSQARRIIVRIESMPNGPCISVIDNGIGIAPDVMPRLFRHGFTTRESGHGFGLHSAALAAKELGGKLEAYSEGTGRGATFRLTLPQNSPEQRNE